MRSFLPIFAALCASTCGQMALAQDACVSVVRAELVQPTSDYGHGAVENGEYSAMRLSYQDGGGAVHSVRVGTNTKFSVFEDTHARVVDLDGDGCNEVVVTSALQQQGARVEVYGLKTVLLPDSNVPKDEQAKTGIMAQPLGLNDPIGTRYRWLGIVGVADFDGDGIQDIAYVDRPHLAKTLRILKTQVGATTVGFGRFHFEELASAQGLTNHHYKSPIIEGGVRDCAGQVPVIVTANATWSHVMETVWDVETQSLVSTEAGTYRNEASFAPFLSCS